MVFRLSDAAAAHFSKMDTRVGSSKIEFLKFDMYYACLMVGLLRHSIIQEPDTVSELGETFLPSDVGYPGPFKGAADLIAGLLIEAELERKNIGHKDRAEIESQTTSLLEPNSPVRLSERGIKLLNRYAAGGFELLRSETMAAPRSIAEFFMAYDALIQKKLS